MNELITIMIMLTLNSCSIFKEKGIEMRIKNDSCEPITHVEFTTTEKLDVIGIDTIEPNESTSEFLSMRKNKTDGSYLLTFNGANGGTEIVSDRYYTNGGPLDQWINFIVENDTTIVNFD